MIRSRFPDICCERRDRAGNFLHMLDPDEVRSREDLVQFVTSLRNELVSGSEWENDTLDRYLEALAGFTQDLHGAYENQGEQVPEQPTWSTVARMLLAATAYE